ncbi:hypothetical protein bcere0018_53620 [Bacillus cereus Rock1-15]|uniref:hypothetical protein n=1 Tax=Bacillus cereus TaxID=1396 RepID=UPI0001A07E7D|nr:hypothetical protein [Bacillus cereus]EEL25646.1 hypothetical protein bcere0018_53620 [Bacillus cereus Rock1-15]
MNPLKDIQLTYWLVNLGNMYYAGGLLRKREIESSFSYEFVNDEVYAFPFLEEQDAINVAKQCGGIVVDRAATSEELTVLEERNERYINSESQARLEQEINIREDIRRT